MRSPELTKVELRTRWRGRWCAIYQTTNGNIYGVRFTSKSAARKFARKWNGVLRRFHKKLVLKRLGRRFLS